MVRSAFFRRTTFGLLASAFAACSSFAVADDPAPPAEEGGVAAAAASLDPSDLPIEELARRLDSDSFDERQAATEALAKRGTEATPLLEKLATEGTREVKSRALDLLIGQAKAEEDSEPKTTAKAALERLAKSADAYASRRAAEALAPPPAPTERPQMAEAPRVQVLPIGPGFAPNIRVQAIAQNGLKVQRRNVNGVETIEAEEGDRKVRATKTADGKIEMEIVDKKDGKETTEKIAAKDEADLKANSPKAYELYRKYAGDGGLQAQIILGNAIPGGFPGGIPAFAPPIPGAPPFPAPAAPPFPVPAPPANELRLEMLKRMLQNVQRQEQRIQEQIDEIEKEMQAKEPPAEAPAPEAPNADREAGSDANGGSDD
jgi:hypothetical protein